VRSPTHPHNANSFPLHPRIARRPVRAAGTARFSVTRAEHRRLENVIDERSCKINSRRTVLNEGLAWCIRSKARFAF
jgi:hypothetical protein